MVARFGTSHATVIRAKSLWRQAFLSPAHISHLSSSTPDCSGDWGQRSNETPIRQGKCNLLVMQLGVSYGSVSNFDLFWDQHVAWSLICEAGTHTKTLFRNCHRLKDSCFISPHKWERARFRAHIMPSHAFAGNDRAAIQQTSVAQPNFQAGKN